MTALHELRFRSSPHIELKAIGELSAEQREAFRDLESDPDFYGLFVPRPPLSTSLKSVGRQTAELFRALAAPSRLDAAFVGDDGVIDLVLDGILEIESDGGFVFGADALPLLCPRLAVPPAADAVVRLSREALLHGQDLETADAQTLSMALYYFNRIPLAPFWKARFPDRAAVLAHLGADRGTLRALLEREWIFYDGMSGWLCWTPRVSVQRGEQEVTYKLYVSPRPERIRESFETVARVLASFPGTQFKIGDGAAGLLRPDKLVAYFATREELGEAAAVLRRELAGCDAHGVPFTAGLEESGLLSWGVDPPDGERALRWLGRESWRLWLAQRLGAALAVAKIARGNSGIEPWQFAIERARRQGVDVDTWTPSATLWSRG